MKLMEFTLIFERFDLIVEIITVGIVIINLFTAIGGV
jgi:hypothetical protein